MVILVPEPFKDETGLTRRTVMRTAAWSVPVIAAAVAIPMAAASGTGTLSDFQIVPIGNDDAYAHALYVFAVASPDIEMTLQPSYFMVSGSPSVSVANILQHRYDNLGAELLLNDLIFANDNRTLTVNIPGFASVTTPIVFP